MRTLTFILIVCTGILFTGCKQVAGLSEENKPNIVFILADDMGYGDLGCYNADSKIATPNIDGLASQGIRFTNAHAAGAWCVPSRYGLLTGRYPGRLESMNTRSQSLIKSGQSTLASMLKGKGYRTACVGKWHQGFRGLDWETPKNIDVLTDGPVEKGFDYFFGMHASLDIPPYFYIENDKAVQAPDLMVADNASPDATSDVSGAFWRGGATSPDFKHEEVLDKFFEKACAFLDKHQSKHSDKPFFLYFPLTAPHTPWLPAEAFVGKSGAGEYGDFTMQVDYLVGQVLDYLEEQDLMENTIVFFSSDNGPVWFFEDIEKYDHASVGALRGMKGDLWEGGSRIPFIVSAPSRYKPGRVSDQMIGFTDMMATLADMVGSGLIEEEKLNQDDFDSHSFLHVLENRRADQDVREEVIIEKRAILSGDWKFIDGSGQGGIAARWAPDKAYIVTEKIPGELYNLNEDLSEQQNLYDIHPEIANELLEKLTQNRHEN
jgi:arylsulfatase A-like enzyme